MLYYTGIGSRKTPRDILEQMNEIAMLLADRNWILRSGGAPGADTAFESGCSVVKGKKEIFLPWKNFNNNNSNLYNVSQTAEAVSCKIWNETFPDSWKHIRRPVQLLMSRNVHQILGEKLKEPSSFVICWTPDGVETQQKRSGKTGGTGQAIALANNIGIPVFNLFNAPALEKLFKFIEHLTQGS